LNTKRQNMKIKRNKTVRFFSIAVAILFCFSFLPKQDEQIIWSKDHPLAWEDFKGKPINYSSSGAITSSGFDPEYRYEKGILIIKSVAFFSPMKSWVKEESKDKDGLQHEQGHFDISEIYVRRFRKCLNEEKFKSKNIKENINKIYALKKIELNIYQDDYDKETSHHLNKAKQNEWLDKITKELEALEAYKNPVLEIKVK
jgi:hypothetical protein